MKKIFISITVVIIAYIILVEVLDASGVCPKYINLMPQVVGYGIETKNPYGYKWCNILFPFRSKVY